MYIIFDFLLVFIFKRVVNSNILTVASIKYKGIKDKFRVASKMQDIKPVTFKATSFGVVSAVQIV